MVCIYCSNKTQVTNSRPQKRLGQTWRRRQCQGCGAIFTTLEILDYQTSFVVRSGKHTVPLDRDKLFVSVFRTVGHRKRPVTDASALTATILKDVRKQAQNGAISPQEISKAVHEVLQRFDTAAAVQYAAYHRS